MMECKKALTEAVGDMDKAEEILRVKLGNKASKAASRVTAEGIVGIYLSRDGKRAAMVELNCETDFVARTTTSSIWPDPRRTRCRREAGRCGRAVRGTASATRRSRKCAPRWSARSAKTCHPSLRVRRGQGSGVELCPRRLEDRCAGRSGRRGRGARQGPRDAYCRQQAEIARRQRRIERPDRYRAPYRHREGARAGKPEAMLEKIAEGTVQKFLRM